MSEGFHITEHGPVTELNINLNASNQFDEKAFLRFEQEISEIRAKKSASVLMLTSGADGIFSSGLNPAQLAGKKHDEIHRTVDILNRSTFALFDFPLPVVSVLSGHAMGGGALFAIFSDFRLIADKKARIGFPEVNLSMCLGAGPTIVLSNLIGEKNARDLLYTGKALKPEEAKSIGLIDEIYPVDSIQEKALAFCQKLAKAPRPALKAIKRGFRENTKALMKSLSDTDRDILVRTILTPEAQEGFTALLEGRRPDFEKAKAAAQ